MIYEFKNISLDLQSGLFPVLKHDKIKLFSFVSLDWSIEKMSCTRPLKTKFWPNPDGFVLYHYTSTIEANLRAYFNHKSITRKFVLKSVKGGCCLVTSLCLRLLLSMVPLLYFQFRPTQAQQNAWAYWNSEFDSLFHWASFTKPLPISHGFSLSSPSFHQTSNWPGM